VASWVVEFSARSCDDTMDVGLATVNCIRVAAARSDFFANGCAGLPLEGVGFFFGAVEFLDQ